MRQRKTSRRHGIFVSVCIHLNPSFISRMLSPSRPRCVRVSPPAPHAARRGARDSPNPRISPSRDGAPDARRVPHRARRASVRLQSMTVVFSSRHLGLSHVPCLYAAGKGGRRRDRWRENHPPAASTARSRWVVLCATHGGGHNGRTRASMTSMSNKNQKNPNQTPRARLVVIRRQSPSIARHSKYCRRLWFQYVSIRIHQS